MSKTSEALADVRRWLCENLSAGDAGKVCGMLSVVSRHIATLEAENVKLRKFASEFVGCANCVDDHEVTDAIEEYAAKFRMAGDGE